ncbi:AlbA family DNA-binding domain-containing protein [Paraburkholderia hospita]|uniref:AlbA family DNA-binding domain-containing protein n=1 Tax=Paraburkholderia hospita TaxID=169430 RepID=UPI000271B625|nr:ATP-binding protein [Paraburkholderia hospita]EUC18838.1 AAA-4 family protein [Burkholderia sp. BT03]SKC60523.1 Putative DNA-binding domain-containing protein [Paraburkholderia hospita]
MDLDNSRIQALVDRPAESLSVEIKTWFNPESVEGQVKLVRTLLALRNHDGGYFVIGIDDKTLTPDTSDVPANVKELFHPDKLHALISRFASEPFEIVVEFVKRDRIDFPVIVVPSGTRTPVAAKSDLKLNDKRLVSTGDVYVRTLNANRIPSSARANWNDWASIVDVCFNNREADIGRFMRRHLTGSSAETLKEIFAGLSAEAGEQNRGEKDCSQLLDQGRQRFISTVAERQIALPDTGYWEVAMQISGAVTTRNLRDFLHLLSVSHPEHSGWPVFLVSNGFGDLAARPHVVDEKWEALILSSGGRHIDFVQFDPKGRFYHLRALFDDMRLTDRSPQPRTVLDYSLPILDCAEGIAVGLAFAKAMGCDDDECSLEFAFRWSGLKGRQLGSWAIPSRYISPGRTAYQDGISLFQTISANMPPSAIGGVLSSMLQPLYELFDGFQVSSGVVEDLATRVIERKSPV